MKLKSLLIAVLALLRKNEIGIDAQRQERVELDSYGNSGYSIDVDPSF